MEPFQYFSEDNRDLHNMDSISAKNVQLFRKNIDNVHYKQQKLTAKYHLLINSRK
jgi:hypothetical protein